MNNISTARQQFYVESDSNDLVVVETSWCGKVENGLSVAHQVWRNLYGGYTLWSAG
jgi:hypothetical protein